MSWLFGVLLIHSLGFNIFLELWMQIKIVSSFNFNLLSFYTWKISQDFAIDNNQNHQNFIELLMKCLQLYLLLLYLL